MEEKLDKHNVQLAQVRFLRMTLQAKLSSHGLHLDYTTVWFRILSEEKLQSMIDAM